MKALAPGYTKLQESLDEQMVAIGRPSLSPKELFVTLLDKDALAAHQAVVEAWEHANPEAAAKWLELRALTEAEWNRAYAERYGAEAYARERMRRVGFEDALVDKAQRELAANACFVAARDWMLDGTQWSLVLIGDPGCGKTQSATWAAHQLMTRGFAPRCCACPRVSEAPLYGGEAEEYRWRCREEASVLVLDDLGEGEQRNANRSAWRGWVDEVLSQRYAQRRKTIITTNRTVPELSEWLGARLVDRLREGSVVSTAEKSLRGAP